MAKKILILSGSPRKQGNSDLLCDEFMRGALEAGHEVEKIRVQEKKVACFRGYADCVAGAIEKGTNLRAFKRLELKNKKSVDNFF